MYPRGCTQVGKPCSKEIKYIIDNKNTTDCQTEAER